MEDSLFKFRFRSLIALAFSLLAGCATELVGDPSDLSKIEFPTGMVIHPNGRYAYVVGSNFNLNYRANDGGAVYVVDLENQSILPTSKRIGSFGTNIVLSSDAKHGFVVTRDDDALVWFEISDDGSSIRCPKAGNNAKSLLKCRVILDDDPTFIALTHSYRNEQITTDSNLTITQKNEFDILAIPQLRNARVTMMTVKSKPNGSLSFSHESAALLFSPSEAVWLNAERFIVSGRAASSLIVASPALNIAGKVLGVYASQVIAVPSGYGVYQGRAMALAPSKQFLYLLNQYPNALLKFDISGLDDQSATTDRANMTAMSMLPVDMTRLIWVGDNSNGMLYATSVVDDALYIFNPQTLDIVKKIQTGDGPYEMTLQNHTLYLLHFEDGSIWKFDVSQPDQPTLSGKIFSNEAMSE